MNRLVLRLSVGIFVALLFSVTALFWIGRSAVIRNLERDSAPSVDYFVDVIQERLRGLDPTARRESAEALADSLNCEVVIVPRNAAALPQSIRDDIVTGRGGVRLGFFDPSPILYVPLVDVPEVAVFGPLDHAFGPGPREYLLMVLAALAIVIGVGVLLSAPVVRRLKRLEKTALRIASGDLSARANVDTSRADAVGSLARRFNEMATQIERLLEDQRHMLQAVAHELRTPTARIRFGLEMLESTQDPAAREERLSAIDEDLTELDALVGELLQYLRYEEARRHGETIETPTFLAPVVTKLIQRARDLHPQVEVRLDAIGTALEDLRVNADPRALHRALHNLLQNALRYANGHVAVEVVAEEKWVAIHVLDDGPGISPEDRGRVFEPFARVDHSRSRGTGGVGLGLAIVARILEAQGGRVAVGESPWGGARFTLCWRRL
jgi:two-component system, OmpR family, sensor histidine kinase RstB